MASGSAGLAGIVTAYWRVFGDGLSVPSSPSCPTGTWSWSSIWAIRSGSTDRHSAVFSRTAPSLVLCRKRFAWITEGLVNTFGIRFHPARGAGFLGKTATELAERLLPLARVCTRLDRAVSPTAQGSPRGWRQTPAATALDQVLLDQLRYALPPDIPVIAAVDRLTDSDVMPFVKELAYESHISARQLQRRFRTAVGMTPKRFVRVVRFARVATGLDEPAQHLGGSRR